MQNQRRLRRAVLKEELAELTGDAITALVLSQILYWSERVRDVDRFLKEEQERSKKALGVQPTRGWIYKSAEDLADELMNVASPATIRRRLKALVKAGWLHERTNPHHLWDRTIQYRPDIVAIQRDLLKRNYALEGYPLQLDASILQGEECILQIEESSEQIEESSAQFAESSAQGAGAIPKTTIKTSTETKEEITILDFPPMFSDEELAEERQANAERHQAFQEGRGQEHLLKAWGAAQGDPWRDFLADTEWKEQNPTEKAVKSLGWWLHEKMGVQFPVGMTKRNWLKGVAALVEQAGSAKEARAIINEAYNTGVLDDLFIKSPWSLQHLITTEMGRRKRNAQPTEIHVKGNVQ